MFGMGWSEMMLVGIVALIVIGPKDLPGVFHQMGQFAGKARGMAREFTNAMNDAARESGMSDIQKTLNAAANPKKFGVDKLREATGTTTAKGPATAALSEERAASKAKFEAAAADIVHKRKAAEAAAADTAKSVIPAAAAPQPTATEKPKAAADPDATPAAKPRAPRQTKSKDTA